MTQKNWEVKALDIHDNDRRIEDKGRGKGDEDSVTILVTVF